MPDPLFTHKQASELYDRLSRAAAARNARAHRRHVVQSVAAVLLLVGVAIPLSLALDRGGRSRSPSEQASVRKTNSSHFSLGGSSVWTPPIDTFYNDWAQSVSLADAKARASIPVLAPSADAVNAAIGTLVRNAPKTATAIPDNSIRKVWFIRGRDDTGAQRDAVSIEYNQLEISEADMGPDYDGPGSYRGMLKEFLVAGQSLGTIDGSVALISPPHTDNEGVLHPGLVYFMKGTVQIRVEGYYPAAQLVAIANSLS